MLFSLNSSLSSSLSNKFSFKKSINEQMNYISELRASQPQQAKILFEKGEQFIKCASLGEFRKLRTLVDSYEEDEIFAFFTVKMFHESLINGHLMISSYIIDNGYPYKLNEIPSAFHSSLEIVDDSRGVAIVEFFISKKYDLNKQIPGSWLTPLHISVRRKLQETCLTLIRNGADVNAVAKDDVMPLTIALSLEDSPEKDAIVSLLKKEGAKETWRRDVSNDQQSTYTGVKKMETKYVKFSGGDDAVVSSSPLVSMSGGSGFVSMKGMFSTSQPLEITTLPTSNSTISSNSSIPSIELIEQEIQNISITQNSNVESEARPRKPRKMMGCVSSGVLSVSDLNTTSIIEENTNIFSTSSEINTKPIYEKSSDGGMMFSTGS